MGVNMDLIKKRLNKLNTQANADDIIWKPSKNEATIRIVTLPYSDRGVINAEDPFIEMYFHYNTIKIDKQFPLSTITFGDEDPIAEFAENLKEEAKKEYPDGKLPLDEWKITQNLKPSKRTFIPIIVRGKEKDGIKYWGIGETVVKTLLEFYANEEDYGDISDFETGMDLKVKHVPNKKGGQWPDTNVMVRPKVTRVTDDPEIMKLITEKSNIPDLFDRFPVRTYDELKHAFEKYIGATEGENTMEQAKNALEKTKDAKNNKNSNSTKKEAPKVEATVTNAEAKTTVTKSKEDLDKEFDALLG